MARRGLFSEVLPSAAGLHVTAHLTDGLDEQSVRAAAARRGVALGDYAGCWQRAPRTEGLLVGFGAVPSDSLPSALDERRAPAGVDRVRPLNRDRLHARLLLFSASGFEANLTREAARRGDVELIDAARLYTGA